jgi:L-threonylcarbamoyladenylate synthase
MTPHVVSLHDPEVPSLVQEALETGRTLVFPTDTVYGIGGNPWDEAVLARVRHLKARPTGRPFTLHLPRRSDVGRYADLGRVPLEAVDRLLPGPYTLLLPASVTSPRSAVRDGVIGIRVPDHPFFREIVAGLDRPLFATSVNRSGEPPLSDVNEIIERFPSVDLIVVGTVGTAESTIVDLTTGRPRTVRGTLPDGLFWAALGEEQDRHAGHGEERADRRAPADPLLEDEVRRRQEEYRHQRHQRGRHADGRP